MYWPSVQVEVTSVSPLTQVAVYVAPRLFGRRVLLDLKDLPTDSQPGSSMQPLRALLQPITDKLSRHVEIALAAFSQSTTTSPDQTSRRTNVNGRQHEKSACRR